MYTFVYNPCIISIQFCHYKTHQYSDVRKIKQNPFDLEHLSTIYDFDTVRIAT